MEKTITTRTQYIDLCPKCKKEIKGGSESHVKHNVKIHLISKHDNPNDEKGGTQNNGK